MLVLTRNPGERVIITHEPTGEKIIIQVMEPDEDHNRRARKVRLGFGAARVFVVDREEVAQRKEQERE